MCPFSTSVIGGRIPGKTHPSQRRLAAPPTGVARCVPNDGVRNAVLRLRGVSCGSSLVNSGHMLNILNSQWHAWSSMDRFFFQPATLYSEHLHEVTLNAHPQGV